MACKSGRNTDGTFAKGNSGKPQGSRHKATRAVSKLLDGSVEALTQRAIDMALGGDTVALRLCLERIAPPRKDVPIAFALPKMETIEDVATAAAEVVRGVAGGEVTPIEGTAIMGLVDSFRRTLEVTELEARLQALENSNGS